MTIQAIVINPDATFTVGPIDASLKGLQGIVGGYIEAVTTDDTTIFINEEGKLTGQEFNPLATLLWWQLAPHMRGVDVLVGPAVVLGPVDGNGNETAVTKDTVDVFSSILFFATMFGDEDEEAVSL